MPFPTVTPGTHKKYLQSKIANLTLKSSSLTCLVAAPRAHGKCLGWWVSFQHSSCCCSLLSVIANCCCRLLCAVESAMRKLGNASVTVLTDNLEDFGSNWPSNMFNPGRMVSIARCLEGTPLRGWLDSPELATSLYRQQNIANALRMAALYKSGGTYLDLDIIPLHQEFFDPGIGSISKQCEEEQCGNSFFLNNAFLSFPARDRFLHRLMEAFVIEYNGEYFCHDNLCTCCTICQ